MNPMMSMMQQPVPPGASQINPQGTMGMGMSGMPQGADMMALLQQLQNPMGMAQAGAQPTPMSPQEAVIMSMLTKNGMSPPTTQQTPGMMQMLAMLTGGGGMGAGAPPMGAPMGMPMGGPPPMQPGY